LLLIRNTILKMRKITYVLIGILFLFVNTLKAQEPSRIETKQSFGVIFLQNGKKLSPRQLLEITKDNPEAYEEMKIAKSNSDIGAIFGAAGGFLVGYSLGSAISGGDPEWTIGGVGAGLILLSIPFTSKYSKHAKLAVEMYNRSLSENRMKKVDFNFGLTRTGIGITLNF